MNGMNAEHYRGMAFSCLAQSSIRLNDPHTAETWKRLAAEYEKLAVEAEARAKGGSLHQ